MPHLGWMCRAAALRRCCTGLVLPGIPLDSIMPHRCAAQGSVWPRSCDRVEWCAPTSSAWPGSAATRPGRREARALSLAPEPALATVSTGSSRFMGAMDQMAPMSPRNPMGPVDPVRPYGPRGNSGRRLDDRCRRIKRPWWVGRSRYQQASASDGGWINLQTTSAHLRGGRRPLPYGAPRAPHDVQRGRQRAAQHA